MSQKPCQNCQKTISLNAQFCPYCGQPQTFSPLLTGQLPASAMLDNRYAVDTLVGRGGMGAVYRAVDTRLTGRICAIKEMSVLNLPPQERGPAIHSFRQEAQLLATLQHPNLPKVHDFFQDGTSGRHYLVMDFVQGDTLEDLLQRQRRPFPEQQIRAWGWQLCDVLTYLHSHHPPIIFRDLKPQNIMLEQNGQLKLIDFGIARFFQPAKTQDTQAFGTIGYSPPEQHGRGQTDARSDVYSLGATLWRLLTGQDPGDNPYQLPGVRRYNPSISAELESVVQRAMQLQPDARYPTALEFGNALQGQAASPTPKGGAATSPRPQRPVAVWMALIALLLVVGGGAGLFWFNVLVTS
jgi:serine/threonine protein kinase, bacterial